MYAGILFSQPNLGYFVGIRARVARFLSWLGFIDFDEPPAPYVSYYVPRVYRVGDRRCYIVVNPPVACTFKGRRIPYRSEGDRARLAFLFFSLLCFFSFLTLLFLSLLSFSLFNLFLKNYVCVEFIGNKIKI